MIRKSVKRFSEKIVPQQQAAYMPQLRQENGFAIVKIVSVLLTRAASSLVVPDKRGKAERDPGSITTGQGT
jgi:hypothetical protein